MFPSVPNWYVALHMRIYSFHMANFYFLCGFLVAHSYHRLSSFTDFFAYYRKRLVKFGVPFLILGLLFCLAKSCATQNMLNGFLLGIKFLFLETTRSPATYLWFILVLFQFYLIAPALCQYSNYTLPIGLLVAILLNFHPLPRYLCLHQFSRYFLFFTLGITVHKAMSLIDKRYYWFCLAFYPVFAFSLWNVDDHALLPSLSSIPVFAFASHCLSKFKSVVRISDFLSRRCFQIYLYQVIFINALALIVAKTISLDIVFGFFLIIVVPFAFVGAIFLDNGIKYCGRYIFKCA